MGTHSNLVLTVSGKKYIFFYQYDGYSQYEIFVNDILELYKTRSYSDVKQEFETLKIEKVYEYEVDSPNGISWILDLGCIPYDEDAFEDVQYILRVDFDENLVVFENSDFIILSKKISEITEDDLKYNGVYIRETMEKYYNLENENSEQFKNLIRMYESPIEIVEKYEAGEGIPIEKVVEPTIYELAHELLLDEFWREYVDETLLNSRLFRFDEKNLNPNYVYITGLRIAGRPDILRKIPELSNPLNVGDSPLYYTLKIFKTIYTANMIANTGKDEKVNLAVLKFENDEYWLDIREVTMEEALKYCS